jgi:hypothetical protein
MQEEVENKTVNLAVRTGTVSSRVLYQALRGFVQDQRSASANRAARRESRERLKIAREERRNAPKHGKQTVKQLIGQGQGVESMDIGDSGVRDFKHIANRYGVDFAIVKDKNENPPRYTVFFKAKDVDAITAVLKDYSAKQMKRKEDREKPSVIEKLKEYKEKVKNTPRRDKEKRKEQER